MLNGVSCRIPPVTRISCRTPPVIAISSFLLLQVAWPVVGAEEYSIQTTGRLVSFGPEDPLSVLSTCSALVVQTEFLPGLKSALSAESEAQAAQASKLEEEPLTEYSKAHSTSEDWEASSVRQQRRPLMRGKAGVKPRLHLAPAAAAANWPLAVGKESYSKHLHC